MFRFNDEPAKQAACEYEKYSKSAISAPSTPSMIIINIITSLQAQCNGKAIQINTKLPRKYSLCAMT